MGNYLKPSPYPRVDAGDLRHFIRIEAPPIVPDDFVTTPQAWTLVRATKASIEQLSAHEQVQSGEISSQVTHRIVMRWTAIQIDPTMRVMFKKQEYKIQSADNVQKRNILIKLMCLAVNDGSNADVTGTGGCA